MSSGASSFASFVAAVLIVGSLASRPALALVDDSTSAVDTDAKGLGLQGYDPVAYFTDGEPEKGDPKFQVSVNGATYYFTSADHAKKFKSDPQAYLPQFGGFCAMGAALNRKFEGDPKVWHVVDGKLYVNVSPDVDKRWSKDVAGNLARANDNWPQIKGKTPKELEGQ